MKRFIVGFFAVIGVIAVMLVVTVGVAGYAVWQSLVVPRPELPERILLTLDLRGTLDNAGGPDPVGLLTGEARPGLDEVLLALDAAAADPRVAGIVARIDATAHGFAAAEELRAAIARLRKAGKRALVHAESFGEGGPGNEGYFVATAFDEIWMQPGGLVAITGLSVEMPFLRGLLDRIGVAPEVLRREAYKTAFESFTERAPTAANREMMEAILDDLFARFREGIGEGRGLDPATVARLVDEAPFTGEEALAAGLLDRIGYYDEMLEAARTAVPEAEEVALGDYAAALANGEEAPVVAFVHASGTILPGAIPAAEGIGSETLREALAAALEDEQVTAVLLRLDSPGGSAVASISIARAIDRLRAAGKPVVVSMVNTAASGGYWIASRADRILASPATLTGSIGVISGKPVLAGLWRNLEVDWASLRRGRNAGIWSFNEPYDAAARQRMERVLDDLYARFKATVAEGRGLSPEEVEAAAKGRIWTGRQALERGLVDRLGGLREALAELRSLLGLEAEAALDLVPFPPPGGPLEWLLALRREFGGLLRLARELRAVAGPPGLASAPPITVR